ncbi:hypothetical protein SDC9_197574 [bioreactor metagenome]|uniref:Uncharacterized protein n=1 Tax=bioreactor metagenome TaxID=1076179 RepID=A0A645IFR4_9ZZZZ
MVLRTCRQGERRGCGRPRDMGVPLQHTGAGDACGKQIYEEAQPRQPVQKELRLRLRTDDRRAAAGGGGLSVFVVPGEPLRHDCRTDAGKSRYPEDIAELEPHTEPLRRRDQDQGSDRRLHDRRARRRYARRPL